LYTLRIRKAIEKIFFYAFGVDELPF